jgi:hypothetical protein
MWDGGGGRVRCETGTIVSVGCAGTPCRMTARREPHPSHIQSLQNENPPHGYDTGVYLLYYYGTVLVLLLVLLNASAPPR